MTFTKAEKKSLWWSTIPLVLLFGALVTFAFSAGNPILRIIVAAVGIVSVIAFLVGIIMIVRYMKEEKAEYLLDLKNHEAFKNLTPEQLIFVTKNAWSPFFNAFVWAFGNGLYGWSFSTLIPGWNIVAMIKFITQGRIISWERGGWKNFEEFISRQKLMMWIIIILIIINIFSSLNGN